MFLKVLKYLVIFLSVSFFGIYFFSIRPNKDEIIFINSLNELGSLNYLSYLYSHWTPRVFSSGLLFSIWKICPNMQYLWVFTGFIYFSVFVYAILMFKKIIAEYFKTAISILDSYLISILSFCSLFFFCKIPAEIFGWYPCILIYLLPCILMIVLILKEEINTLFIFVSGLIIASGAEHIAIFSCAVIVILLFGRFTISQKKKKHHFIFLAITLLFFLFFLFSSGTFSRVLFENKGLSYNVANSLLHLIKFQFSPYLIIGFLLLLTIYQLLPDFPLRLNLKHIVLFNFAGYAVTLFFDLLVFSNTQTGQRIWFLTNILNIPLILILIDSLFKKFSHRNLLRPVLLSITVLILGIFSINHAGKLINYCKKYDVSVYAYQQFKLNPKLTSIPDPGITSSDFPDFSNDMYRKFFNDTTSNK